MKFFLPFFLVLLSLNHVYSQDVPQSVRRKEAPDTTAVPGGQVTQARIKGVIKSASGTTLPGATVVLRKAADESVVNGTATDADGNFRFDKVPTGHYTVKIDYMGFQPFSKTIVVQQQTVDVGVLTLREAATTIDEVVVIGRIPPSEQKGDTTQFNAAAFKSAPDASAQDLVQKMPGITLEDGQLQAQGEAVQRILIDGKPFFGNDVDAALQNLPAQVIANIQVFDKKSDKAELSGFDDGERIRTINIVTKPEARKGQFGRVTAGYGTDNSYMAGASVNFFKNDRRLTVTGLSNNVNQVSFSGDPENSGQTETQNGIIKSNVLGLNYSNTWFEKVELSGSYSFSHRNNESSHERLRDYIQSPWAGQEYLESSRRNYESANHGLNMRLDYEINEQNRIRVRTRGNLNQNEDISYFLGRNIYDEGPLSQSENNSESDNSSYNFDNRIFYSHRFSKVGRSLNFRLHNGFNASNGDRYRTSENISYVNEAESTFLDQYFDSKGNGNSWETEVSYTEPVGRFGQMELEYEIGNRFNESDRRAYDYIDHLENYDEFLTNLSNTFSNEFLTQETELGYRYNNEALYFQVETKYQHAKQVNEQQFPYPNYMQRSFESILPSARLRYKFTESNNLEFNYDTRTNTPSLGQLQDVLDISNPLQFRAGNPELTQSFSNWFRARYRSHNPETNRNFYASIESTIESNRIVNSTADAATSPLLTGVEEIIPGAQLIRPVNLDGYREIRTYFSYGQPVNFIESNLNLRAAISHNRRPGMVNDQVNFSNSNRFMTGISLSSNISERIDFNISTRSSYSVVRNTLRPSQNNNFFSQRTRLWYNWIFGDGFVYRTNLSHQHTTGLAAGYNNNMMLWNMSIGRKLFDRQLGEISLSVFDLLKQNNNINRNITETYIEDVESNVLGRYFMLTFTYNIRNFGGGATIDDFRDRGRD
ncbi:TonB-dependent receptor [Botryobacter ruber]|uniref:TonB-dependent receptor n=1 Tax=Botryobacter ruber TaxID=2171629 RepID=UPI000E09F602|nr:TonB-dependent receptor [Botryobacter ruber]